MPAGTIAVSTQSGCEAKDKKQSSEMTVNQMPRRENLIKSLIFAVLAAILTCNQAFGQATLLPPGEQCFSALAPTSGGTGGTGTGFLGLLGTITGGSGYVNGTYGGIALTGGSGTNATANITVSGGAVTTVTIVNPGQQYIVGDVLSAATSSIGGSGSGFSVGVSSVTINYALAGGSVGFYLPGTLTFKQTWKDSGEVNLNQNPVPLDQNGCAVIYGAGIYRMILQDSFGNTVYDKLTASTGPAGVFWAGTAGGTPNAITITDPGFALQDGATIQFRAISENTGATTVSVSGGSAISIVQDTATGPAALGTGQIGPQNTPMITYDATNVEFHLVNPSASSGSGGTSAGLQAPQGYLNLVGAASGSVIQGTTDVVAATTVYYSPYVGNQLPIWNGSSFTLTTFTELIAILTSSGSVSSVIQDECVFSNNGVPTLVTGPAWSSAVAGSSSRGAGAGTAQITRLNGIWVNANQIVGYNGSSSYTIPASQCTYVGSISIDSAAGQVSAYRTYGQSRKFGVWNAYNRVPIVVQEGDPTASWTYDTNTVRPANNNTANSITTFVGLPEEIISVTESQLVQVIGTTTGGGGYAFNGVALMGIGFNSTTAFSGQAGNYQTQIAASFSGSFTSASIQTQGIQTATYKLMPSLGINTFTALEQTPQATSITVQYFGSGSQMVLSASYRG